VTAGHCAGSVQKSAVQFSRTSNEQPVATDSRHAVHWSASVVVVVVVDEAASCSFGQLVSNVEPHK
jgi:hypothetical protein